MSHADRSPTASPHDEPGENMPQRRASQSAQRTSDGWTTSSTTSAGAGRRPAGRRAGPSRHPAVSSACRHGSRVARA